MNVFRPAIALLFVFVVLTGLIFPLVVWGAGQALFRHQANGSLIKDAKGNVVGSELIGQNFTDPKYFHPRPSAGNYDAANSGGTNLGPTSEKLEKNLYDLSRSYRIDNGLSPDEKLPADAVTTSASGLDPDISVENAELQTRRVAKARGLPISDVAELVRAHTEHRFLGVYGEPRVNVLALNLALDKKDKKAE